MPDDGHTISVGPVTVGPQRFVHRNSVEAMLFTQQSCAALHAWLGFDHDPTGWGDWVVLEHGEFRVMRDDDFAAEYTPAAGPTRAQVCTIIKDSYVHLAHHQWVDHAANRILDLLAGAPQPTVLAGEVSLAIEAADGTRYLVRFAGCATADGRLLAHPHTPQPGCSDVYRVTIEATETPVRVGAVVEHVDLGRCKVVALGSSVPAVDPDRAYVDFGTADDGEPNETWVPLTDLRPTETPAAPDTTWPGLGDIDAVLDSLRRAHPVGMTSAEVTDPLAITETEVIGILQHLEAQGAVGCQEPDNGPCRWVLSEEAPDVG